MNDDLDGGSGNDILGAGLGQSVLDGGSGNDTLKGTGGANTLIGGNGDRYRRLQRHGYRRCRLAGERPGVPRLSPALAQRYSRLGRRRSFSGIENITGSAYGDHLMGDGGVNVLRGMAGEDSSTAARVPTSRMAAPATITITSTMPATLPGERRRTRIRSEPP